MYCWFATRIELPVILTSSFGCLGWNGGLEPARGLSLRPIQLFVWDRPLGTVPAGHLQDTTCYVPRAIDFFARFGPSGTILDRAGPGNEVASLLQRLPAFFAVFRPSLQETWAVFRTPISMAFIRISKTNSRITKTRLRGVTTVRPAIGPVRPVR